MEQKKEQKRLKIMKTGFAKDDEGNDIFSFSVVGELRHRKVTARLKMDKYLYHQHEYVFGGPNDNYDVYLEYCPETRLDSRTGRETVIDRFVATSYDADDDYTYKMVIQPFSASDGLLIKQLLDMANA